MILLLQNLVMNVCVSVCCVRVQAKNIAFSRLMDMKLTTLSQLTRISPLCNTSMPTVMAAAPPAAVAIIAVAL